MQSPGVPPVHLLIPTHTTRHLAACLAGLAWQTVHPASVTVSCDTDDPAIGRLLAETWPRVIARMGPRPEPPRLLHVWRPHCGEARLNQVRNNGLRALDGQGGIGGVILVLDGDTVLSSRTVEAHAAAAARGAEVLIPYRVNLAENQSAGVSPESILTSRPGADPPGDWVSDRERRSLAGRQRRYERQLLLKRLSAGALVKPHKPKALGGHHAVSVAALRSINGYDEGYVGYGYDDDDLTRRLYRLRPRLRVEVLVDCALAFHLWHPSRAPSRPTDAPGYERFRQRGLPTVARHGWENPLPQPAPRVVEIDAAIRASVAKLA